MIEGQIDDSPVWIPEAPAEPGMYWLWGEECKGSMGMDYKDSREDIVEMHLVHVFKVSNGLMAVTHGRFVALTPFDPAVHREGYVGYWTPATLPVPPGDPFKMFVNPKYKDQ